MALEASMTKAPELTPLPPEPCPYCGGATVLRHSSAHLYYGSDFGPVWECSALCGAWVGCHKGTTKPLGRLADAELRKAKQAAHSAFDRLWRAKMQREGLRKKDARGAGYRWLAEQLGIDPKLCHIGWMDVATCRRVVEICRPHLRSAAEGADRG